MRKVIVLALMVAALLSIAAVASAQNGGVMPRAATFQNGGVTP